MRAIEHHGYLSESVEVEFSASQVLDWIEEDEDRLKWFRHSLLEQEDPPRVMSEIEQVTSMPSLERDAFLADLCRECALLGIEWPADPKAATTIITRDKQ